MNSDNVYNILDLLHDRYNGYVFAICFNSNSIFYNNYNNTKNSCFHWLSLNVSFDGYFRKLILNLGDNFSAEVILSLFEIYSEKIFDYSENNIFSGTNYSLDTNDFNYHSNDFFDFISINNTFNSISNITFFDFRIEQRFSSYEFYDVNRLHKVSSNDFVKIDSIFNVSDDLPALSFSKHFNFKDKNSLNIDFLNYMNKFSKLEIKDISCYLTDSFFIKFSYGFISKIIKIVLDNLIFCFLNTTNSKLNISFFSNKFNILNSIYMPNGFFNSFFDFRGIPSKDGYLLKDGKLLFDDFVGLFYDCDSSELTPFSFNFNNILLICNSDFNNLSEEYKNFHLNIFDFSLDSLINFDTSTFNGTIFYEIIGIPGIFTSNVNFNLDGIFNIDSFVSTNLKFNSYVWASDIIIKGGLLKNDKL